ncbi:uncharacterized protein LOC105163838 [Sesamum indicum]|uniref:Uncharacterized protein LOC105163838 n=1 Tax=Sesamum indicum TaxID=4182 RepID=A0A6I9T8H6_SESIN|nr:uncharacterized protein LOC105163838 [Sesamum indicum]
MLLPYLCVILCFHGVISQTSRALSARELDSLLQDYAFRGLVRPKTGIVYDGKVPSNLTGIGVAALRLRSGSLWLRGVSYKEFHIPAGVVEQPYVERLVLVYHNLGNWSSLYYPLPGYTFLAPVLGLLAYDAADLSATNLPELDIQALGEPISISFPGVQSGHSLMRAMCAYFGFNGSVQFKSVVKGNTCLTTNQGHFSVVVESLAAPPPAPRGRGGSRGGTGGGETSIGGGKGRSKRMWIIGCSVVGGAALLVLLAVIFAYVKRCRHRKKIRRMEDAAELGVPLPMTVVRFTKVPVALQTRTRPLLENEYVP